MKDKKLKKRKAREKAKKREVRLERAARGSETQEGAKVYRQLIKRGAGGIKNKLQQIKRYRAIDESKEIRDERN